MSWDARQQALLSSMGLGEYWGGQAPAVAAVAAAASARRPARPAEPEPEPAPPPAASSAVAPAISPAISPVTSPAAGWTDLDSLHAAVRDCRACGLCGGRRQAVPGIGQAGAHWMVVGEAAGEAEDLRGEPFAGPPGQLLDAMLAALGRSRGAGPVEQQVYISHSVKCRPPGNRNPSAEEQQACAPFLQAELALVRPRVVLALGRFAAQSLLGAEAALGSLRGRVHRLADGTPLVVSYAPSYLLRQPQEKARAWDDLCLAASAAEESKGSA